MATKILSVSVNIIYSPEYENIGQDNIYDIVSREEALETAVSELKRRIKETVPSGSDCSITIGHKIRNK